MTFHDGFQGAVSSQWEHLAGVPAAPGTAARIAASTHQGAGEGAEPTNTLNTQETEPMSRNSREPHPPGPAAGPTSMHF